MKSLRMCRIDRSAIRLALGINKGRIPLDLEVFPTLVRIPGPHGNRDLDQWLWAECYKTRNPSRRYGGGKHRIFVRCPGCGTSIPAGRAAQHRC